VGGNPETLSDPSGQRPCAGPGGPCSWGPKPSGGIRGGGGRSNPLTGPLNAVGLASNPAAAAASYQPICVGLGCAGLLRARTAFQATVIHLMSVNMATIVCTGYCFLTFGEGQTTGSTTIHGETETPFITCGVSPYACSGDNGQGGGDTGVNGHDSPDVSAADTGGGAAGNAGDETGNPEGETGETNPVHVLLPKNRFPEVAAHIQDTYTDGNPTLLHIARDLAIGNREVALEGYPIIPGLDRDEFPMAMTLEGGTGADIRYVNPSENREAGRFIANQLFGYPNGTPFKIYIIDEWLF
jgi:hypothetical protein